MADDCICTALTSLYTMQSDLFSQIVSKLQSINDNLAIIETRVRYLPSINSNLRPLENLHNDMDILNNDLLLIKNSIDGKDLCVSNETIVESPLSTFVSKAKLDIDE